MTLPLWTSTSAEMLSIGLVLFVHFLGGAALIWMLVRESGGSVSDWWPGDDDGPPPPGPREPDPRGNDGGLPLPSAEQALVRVREGERIADAYPRPQRRPVHPPERVPEREPSER